MNHVRNALVFTLLFAGVSQASSANRILECAGVNPALKGCDGYLRLYLSETDAGKTRAMLYSWTIVNSSQTWTVTPGETHDFVGANRAGGKISLSVDSTRIKTLKVAKPDCFPAAVKNLTGHPASVTYEAVYKPYGHPERREYGKKVALVCREP